jgi:hypothetical protein
MKRITPFTLAIAAAFGIAIAPAPAAADRDDVAKIIAGLAIAGIVAKVIDDRNDRKPANNAQITRHDRYNSFDEPRRGRIVDGTLRHRDQPGVRANRGYKRYALPDQCLRILDTARGDRRVYGNRCLQRNYKFANKLPRDCAIRVRTDRGERVVYGSRCLSRDGWSVAGWR